MINLLENLSIQNNLSNINIYDIIYTEDVCFISSLDSIISINIADLITLDDNYVTLTLNREVFEILRLVSKINRNIKLNSDIINDLNLSSKLKDNIKSSSKTESAIKLNSKSDNNLSLISRMGE